MGSTKIIVLQLKELIYTVIFAILGIILILLLIYLFSPKKDREIQPTFSPTYHAGIYTSSLVLDQLPLEVEVRVENQQISSIQLVNFSSELEVMYPFIVPTMQQLEQAIIKEQSLDIPIADDYVHTSKYLIEAIDTALSKSQNDVLPTSAPIIPIEEILE